MEEAIAYNVQFIIDNRSLTDKEKLEAIELSIGFFINKVRKCYEFEYVKCYYKILDRPNSDGLFTIPKNTNIPENYWGKLVDNKEICWYEQRDEQFLAKIGAVK